MNISKDKIRIYTNKDYLVKSLLGGIGTGSVSLGVRGNLLDFEIFNKANKNVKYPYTFFSIFTKFAGEKGQTRMLEAKINEPYEGPIGYAANQLAGIPRFDKSSLYTVGPFTYVKLEDAKLPLEINLEAFSPMIPTNPDDSGIPAIRFKYTVKNKSNKECFVSICDTQSNFTAQKGFDLFDNLMMCGNLKNEFYTSGSLKGINMYSDLEDTRLEYGTMTIATTNDKYTYKTNWDKGGWWDGAQYFFNEFSSDGMLSNINPSEEKEKGPLDFDATLKTGSIAAYETIKPNEEKDFIFYLAWSFPNRPKGWDGHICPHRDYSNEIIKNYYSYRFTIALDAVNYFNDNYERLYKDSKSFAEGLFQTDINKWMLDAINSTITVLRSTTCFRVGEDGKFLAWEGQMNDRGSCEGNCSHVWNYAQALAFLFPTLEQDMRRTEFLIETDDDGNMAFRTMQVLGDPRWQMLPATDGQMGSIIRLYREYMFSGNIELLKECYPKMKKALDFAFSYWDSNGDFVLDSKQHNTYDIEFYGENSLTNSLFFAALKAGSRLADVMNDKESKEKWDNAFAKGSSKMDEMLFNGEYYIQDIDDVNKYKYQYGKGCLSDQIFGQTLAHINSLGYVLPENHIKSAIRSIYKYNYRKGFKDFLCVQRTYALNDDEGLLLCSWPNKDDRPLNPFVYSDEVWSGIEYQVATNLIYEEFEKEAIDIVRSIREVRYNGTKRNPFNEVECGNHYARSLASYGLLLANSGFEFDMPNKTIKFKTKKKPYKTFFTTNNGFGVISIKNGEYNVDMLYGDLKDINIIIKS